MSRRAKKNAARAVLGAVLLAMALFLNNFFTAFHFFGK